MLTWQSARRASEKQSAGVNLNLGWYLENNVQAPRDDDQGTNACCMRAAEGVLSGVERGGEGGADATTAPEHHSLLSFSSIPRAHLLQFLGDTSISLSHSHPEGTSAA